MLYSLTASNDCHIVVFTSSDYSFRALVNMPSIAPATTAEPASTSPKQSTSLQLPANVASIVAPETYFLSHLQADPSLRPSGRSVDAFRPIAVTSSSLTNCLGSAVVRHGETAVVCGITPEILYASDVADPPTTRKRRRQDVENSIDAKRRRKQDTDDLAQLHLLVPNVDLNTGCSPANQAGQPPTSFAMGLSHRLYRLLLSTHLVDIEDLRITRPKRAASPPPDSPNPAAAQVAVDPTGMDGIGDQEEDMEKTIGYYPLHVNLTVLSLDGHSSLFDACWTALLGALRDLRLPRAFWDEDRELIVCSDRSTEAQGLKLRGLPVSCTWAVFESTEITADDEKRNHWTLADPDGFEDGVCDEFVTLVVDASSSKTRILNLEKSGGTMVHATQLADLVKQAQHRWQDVTAAMPPSRREQD